MDQFFSTLGKGVASVGNFLDSRPRRLLLIGVLSVLAEQGISAYNNDREVHATYDQPGRILLAGVSPNEVVALEKAASLDSSLDVTGWPDGELVGNLFKDATGFIAGKCVLTFPPDSAHAPEEVYQELLAHANLLGTYAQGPE
ncbi:MAG: hypothetical protein V1735_01045 [Nanoarchaeota archaeon]